MKMRTKRLFILPIVALVLATKASVLAQTTLSVGTSTGGAGDSVMVPVTLTSDGTVVGLQFDVNAQHGSLTRIVAAKGSALGSSHLLLTNHDLDNSRILIYSNQNVAIPNGEVLQLTFDVIDSASPAEISVSIEDFFVAGPRAAGVSSTAEAGSINVQEANGIVQGRHIFYGGSHFGDTVAPDKSALMPGETATFANYSSYTRGINGVMIDIEGLGSASGIDAADFEFKVGNNNNPSGWSAAPAPSGVDVMAGAGTGGSDRIKITWADGAITKQWLEVTVLANADTGLAENDVFYFGNVIGEAGNSTSNAAVDLNDQDLAKRNPRLFFNPAPIDFDYDYNRDAAVDLSDQDIARRNPAPFFNTLKLITPPASSSGGGGLISSSYEPVRLPGSVVGSIELTISRDDAGQLIVDARNADSEGFQLQFKEDVAGEWEDVLPAPSAQNTPDGARWTFIPGPRQMLYRLIQK